MSRHYFCSFFLTYYDHKAQFEIGIWSGGGGGGIWGVLERNPGKFRIFFTLKLLMGNENVFWNIT